MEIIVGFQCRAIQNRSKSKSNTLSSIKLKVLLFTCVPHLFESFRRDLNEAKAVYIAEYYLVCRFGIAGFQCHAIQNRSKSKSKSKSFNRQSPETENRKKVNTQDSRQDSGHSNFSYARYAEKLFTQVYRDLCGDAMLVPMTAGNQHDAPT